MKANLLRSFGSEDGGQDLIEYTLLLAFVCLGAAALFIGGGQSTSGIWTVATKHLSNASSASS
jgi:Flp pilus assembly pilin Flp